MEIKPLIASGTNSTPKERENAELKKAVAEFEALFINQMLKAMRESVLKSDLFHGGSGEEVYSSLLDTEISRVMASAGGIGLHKVLLEQFSKGTGFDAYTPAGAGEAGRGPTPSSGASGGKTEEDAPFEGDKGGRLR